MFINELNTDSFKKYFQRGESIRQTIVTSEVVPGILQKFNSLRKAQR